ncbi:MAG: rRNA pseudouridine synthase [Bacteroidales bacterium]|nr:rRNA pseudouridine synthase [Bacteroidales bacterium]
MAYKNDRRDDRREDRRGNRGNDRKFAHPFIEDGDWEEGDKAGRGFDRGERRERGFGERRENRFGRDDRGFDRGFDRDRRGFGDRRDNRFGRGGDRFSRDGERGYSRDFRREKPARNAELDYNSERHEQNTRKKEEGYVRLNRYIANAGICSRREADEMIANGVIKVNGEICTVLGTLVGPGDKVQFGDQTLKAEKKVYLLMNKPKGYITTADDPEDRKTVMELLAGACKERIYPVGRLDRNTTGVLLFTNDGEMAKRLTHPSHGARKIYQVTLDHPLAKSDMQSIASGVNLEDGLVQVDEIDYVQEGSRSEVGVVIHSGKNRIVRRIFEHFGYEVVKLDRVLFAELTKKGLERGQWRFLTEKEVSFLQMNTGTEAEKPARAAKSAGRKSPAFTEEQIAEAEAIERAEAELVKPTRGRKKKEEVVEEVEEKPKRGRKKKEEAVVEVEEKPKRGRKKKEEAVVEVEEKPKRGRKKKEEAVVEVVS